MSKCLFDEENGQEGRMPMENANKSLSKKPKPKFTILDDIDEINERINGPGANQESLRAQEMIQKTYQLMKGNPANEMENREVNEQSDHKKSRRNQKSRVQQKENQDMTNISNLQSFEECLKFMKGPRIIVTMKKIDVNHPYQTNRLRIKGFEHLVSSNFGPQAKDSIDTFQDQSGSMLFSKALQTGRNRMKEHTVQGLCFQEVVRKIA